MQQNLVITHHIAAPVAQVWRAFTEEALVRQWWAPAPYTCPLAQMDVRVGGTSLLAMHQPVAQGGHVYYSTLAYEEVQAPTRLAYRHNLCSEAGVPIDPTSVGMPPDFPVNQLHTIDLLEVGDGTTEVVVTEFDWHVGQMMEMSRMGMQMCLEQMARALAT